MDLGPISGFRPLTAVEPGSADPELPPVVRVENSARPDGYNPGRRQAASQKDDEYAASSEESETEPSVPGDEAPPDDTVSFFA
jgi:hypothetical protein